jgi:hypothetical protein
LDRYLSKNVTNQKEPDRFEKIFLSEGIKKSIKTLDENKKQRNNIIEINYKQNKIC